MFKKVIPIFIILPALLLGKINDYRKVFSSEDKAALEKKIDEYEDRTGHKFYLNTLEKNEGFKVISQERTVVLNLTKEGKDAKVEIKISQDLNPEEHLEKINLILDNLQETVNSRDETQVANALVDGLTDIVIVNEETEELNPMSITTKIIIVILLTLLILSLILIVLRARKRKRYLKKR